MPYQLSYASGTGTLTINDNTANTQTVLVLPGKDYVGYGSPVDQNQLSMLEHYASYTTNSQDRATLDNKAIRGQVIFDTVGNQLKVNTSATPGSPNWVTIQSGALPIATTTTLGVIKVGSGLSISADGTLSTGEGVGSVTSVGLTMPSGFSVSGSPITSSGSFTVSTSLNGIIKGTGSGFTTAVAGTDFQGPLTLTTTGTSGAATLIGNILNIPQYTGGGGGGGGYQNANISIYRWAATQPELPSVTTIYTWETGALTVIPTDWTRNAPPNPPTSGWALWALTVRLNAPVSDTSTQFNWSIGSIAQISAPGSAGAPAVTISLSNDNHTLPADNNGNVTSYAGASTVVSMFIGGNDDSTNWTYTTTPSSGVTISGTNTRNIAVTAMLASVDTGYVDIVASRSGYSSQSIRFNLTKGKGGADSVVINLSNDNHTLPATNNGAIISYLGANTTVSIFLGGADDSDNWTYATTTSSGITITGANTRNIAVTNMTTTTETAYVDIVASKTGFANQTARFSLSKARAGADGGAAAVINLTNDNHTLPADFNGTVLSYVGASTVASVYINGVDDSASWTYATSVSSGITISGANTRNIAVTDMDQNTDSAYVDIVASKSGYSNQTARFSLSKAKNGVSAVLLQLSNDNTTLPANNSGVVTSYASAVTTATVFIGGTDDSDNWTYTQSTCSTETNSDG